MTRLIFDKLLKMRLRFYKWAKLKHRQTAKERGRTREWERANKTG